MTTIVTAPGDGIFGVTTTHLLNEEQKGNQMATTHTYSFKNSKKQKGYRIAYGAVKEREKDQLMGPSGIIEKTPINDEEKDRRPASKTSGGVEQGSKSTKHRKQKILKTFDDPKSEQKQRLEELLPSQYKNFRLSRATHRIIKVAIRETNRLNKYGDTSICVPRDKNLLRLNCYCKN